MIKRRELKTYEVREFHDDCGGEFEFEGIELTVYPPLYPHHCNKCNARANFREVYPATMHEAIGRWNVE